MFFLRWNVSICQRERVGFKRLQCMIKGSPSEYKTTDVDQSNKLFVLGKPHVESCRVYLGIAQIAIAPPPLHSNGHPGALYFRADFSKCHLNFNVHCISAPNHPGKGSDPPKTSKCPFQLGHFFSK